MEVDVIGCVRWPFVEIIVVVQNILFLIEKCFTFLRPNGGVYMTADRYIENILCTPLSVHRHCKVTNCSPNPDRIGYGPNKPSTINL